MRRDTDWLTAQPLGNPALQLLALQQHVVMLQGPVGPAMGKLANWLLAKGACVHKICLHAGDVFDISKENNIHVHQYSDCANEWPTFFRHFLLRNRIGAVILFGQARWYHRQAISVARLLGVHVLVMEEGYFRPGFVTLELDGVNGYSRVMDYVETHLALQPSVQPPAPIATNKPFQKMALHAALHYLAMWAGRNRFPHYVHHRASSPWRYAAIWLRSWGRKALRWLPDHVMLQKLIDKGVMFFFVPLQCPEDHQIGLHSRFDSIEAFIDEVMASFAQHAPAQAHLLIKQHPMSRGETLYAAHVRRQAKQLGLEKRVHFVTEAHNPTVLDHCRGVVLINSTMGLQALAHRRPVKALGDSFYNRKGLTDQRPLERFWRRPQPPGPQTQSWLALLKLRTQVPCALYAFRNEPWKGLP